MGIEDDAAIKPIYEAPVNSVMLAPNNGDVLELTDVCDGCEVVGVAIPAGGHRIAKIEVFAGGEWHLVDEKDIERTKEPPGRCWSWVRFSTHIPKKFLKPCDDGKITLAVRATGDNSEDTSNWNLRGYLNNRYHTISFTLHHPP